MGFFGFTFNSVVFRAAFKYKFHEILSSDCKVMALNGWTEKRMDGRMDRRMAEHGPNYIPPPMAGDN